MTRRGWSINERVALVTGGARGIGLDAARRLAARGMRVSLVDIDGDLAAAEAEAIGRERAIGLTADVADRRAVGEAVEATAAAFGGVDVVIANAGVAPPSQTLRLIDDDAYERTLEVNLGGVFNTVRAALPEIVAREGYVLVLGSLYVALNGVLASPYAISKAAVEQLARALRVELAPHGASAGIAYFAFVDTELVRDAFSRPAVERLRTILPAWMTRPIAVSRAGSAIAEAVERRSARVTVPWWVAWLLAARGLMGPFDERLARDPRVAAVIEWAEDDQRSS